MDSDTSEHRFKPWLFFGALALPGILSMIVLSIDNSNYGEAGLLTLMFGSVIAGIVCGIHFTVSRNATDGGKKVLIGIFSVIGCALAAFALGTAGCFLIAAVAGNL